MCGVSVRRRFERGGGDAVSDLPLRTTGRGAYQALWAEFILVGCHNAPTTWKSWVWGNWTIWI